MTTPSNKLTAEILAKAMLIPTAGFISSNMLRPNVLFTLHGDDIPVDTYVSINLLGIPGRHSDGSYELTFSVQINSTVKLDREELDELLKFASRHELLNNAWLLAELGSDLGDSLAVRAIAVDTQPDERALDEEDGGTDYASRFLLSFQINEDIYTSAVSQFTTIFAAISRNAIAQKAREAGIEDISTQLAETAIAAAAGKSSPTSEEGSKENGPL